MALAMPDDTNERPGTSSVPYRSYEILLLALRYNASCAHDDEKTPTSILAKNHSSLGHVMVSVETKGGEGS